MILVDSSILVEFFRDAASPDAARLAEALEAGLTVGIEPHIYQEVLQGARDERDWKQLADALAGQTLYQLKQGLDSHRWAARIYYDCRRRGLTVRSLVDCIVAQTALENDLWLLARDRDYRSIALVRPIRFWQGGSARV